MLYPEVDLYNRGPKDPMLHRKNFLLHCKELLNVDMIRSGGKDKYMKLLKATQDALKGVDFKQNVLFICSERVQKEIFLCGMLTFENLESFYYCNLLKIADIWLGNTRQSNPNIEDGDIHFSEQDIKQRVLCMYCDCDMIWGAFDNYDGVARNLFLSRTAGNRYDGKPQYNWTFFRGVRSQMKKSDGDKIGFDSIINFYESEGVVVDLNKNTEYIQTVKGILGKSSSVKKVGGIVKSKKDEQLSDVY